MYCCWITTTTLRIPQRKSFNDAICLFFAFFFFFFFSLQFKQLRGVVTMALDPLYRICVIKKNSTFFFSSWSANV